MGTYPVWQRESSTAYSFNPCGESLLQLQKGGAADRFHSPQRSSQCLGRSRANDSSRQTCLCKTTVQTTLKPPHTGFAGVWTPATHELYDRTIHDSRLRVLTSNVDHQMLTASLRGRGHACPTYKFGPRPFHFCCRVAASLPLSTAVRRADSRRRRRRRLHRLHRPDEHALASAPFDLLQLDFARPPPAGLATPVRNTLTNSNGIMRHDCSGQCIAFEVAMDLPRSCAQGLWPAGGWCCWCCWCYWCCLVLLLRLLLLLPFQNCCHCWWWRWSGLGSACTVLFCVAVEQLPAGGPAGRWRPRSTHRPRPAGNAAHTETFSFFLSRREGKTEIVTHGPWWFIGSAGGAAHTGTVQDMFHGTLYQQHASHTLASRAFGPQPHLLSSSATGPYTYTALGYESWFSMSRILNHLSRRVSERFERRPPHLVAMLLHAATQPLPYAKVTPESQPRAVRFACYQASFAANALVMWIDYGDAADAAGAVRYPAAVSRGVIAFPRLRFSRPDHVLFTACSRPVNCLFMSC